MKYIPDKKLYSAVMFALKMCPSLNSADDSKISVASDYYHVNKSDVLEIVKQELWSRAIDEAKKEKDSWTIIFNPSATDLLGMGIFNDWVFVCPECGARYAFNVHDDYVIDKMYVSQCKCGFADKFQRECVRKDLFIRLQEKGEQINESIQ